MKIFSWLLFPSLIVLFLIFFKIGLVFFGGGYVVIPVLHRELVSNLHLLTERQFIDGVAISQLTPGPIAIFATFAGYCISGVWGALTSTFAMFLPGICLMMFLSKSYEKIQNSSFAIKVFDVLTPVVVGLLIATVFQMGKTTINSWFAFLEFFVALFLLMRFKANPALLIVLSAVIGLVLKF